MVWGSPSSRKSWPGMAVVWSSMIVRHWGVPDSPCCCRCIRADHTSGWLDAFEHGKRRFPGSAQKIFHPGLVTAIAANSGVQRAPHAVLTNSYCLDIVTYQILGQRPVG